MIYDVYSWIILILIIIAWIVACILLIWGLSSEWYHSLISPNINPYLLGFGLLFAVVFFSISLYLALQELVNPVFYLLGVIILLGWLLVLYTGHNLSVAMWFGIFLFLYHFWLILYMWDTIRSASYFLYPTLLVYIFFFYYTVHLISRNNVDV